MAKDKPIPGQEALFPEDVVERRAPEPTRTIKSEGMASCPGHIGTGKRETGLVRIGKHLVWRDHDKVTARGVPMRCWCALIPICQDGARPKANSRWVDPKTGKKPLCPHDRPGYREGGWA